MSVIDLFSGCGGMSLGFKNAGFRIQLAVDNWEAAVNNYRQNFEHPIAVVDLSIDDKSKLFSNVDFNMIIGGPPCQDFSSAGKRDEALGRAYLTIHFAEIISTHTPDWFVMENVERITKSGFLNTAMKIFTESGYGLTKTVLNASYYGVPQKRKRFFLIGRMNGEENELIPYLKANQSTRPMTVAEYFKNDLDTGFYYRHPRSYKRRGIFSIHEPSPTIRGVNRPIPSNYLIHSGDASKDLSKVRPLTTQERAMIQTFPKNFIFTGTKGEIEQMIGNAVPVNLANHVANSILEFINDLRKGNVKRVSQTEVRV